MTTPDHLPVAPCSAPPPDAVAAAGPTPPARPAPAGEALPGPDQTGAPAGDDAIAAVLDLFRARGGRVTESRRLLLHCLFERQGHRTADELVAQVNALDPAVHRSTVYRNLDELEQLGVVEHVHLGHGPATYHLREDRHGHLVCERCGQSIAVPEALFDNLEQAVLRRYGFLLQPRHFAVQGTCASCAASDTTDPTTTT
ncbi:MAG: Fur family transcriptional regulator [Actinomycetota bacterium]|jgi:Fe2+ or Zn2+ uptake regulation protein|nr:Fur family transcriptional regulator [Actinomycetota bacterium]